MAIGKSLQHRTPLSEATPSSAKKLHRNRTLLSLAQHGGPTMAIHPSHLTATPQPAQAQHSLKKHPLRKQASVPTTASTSSTKSKLLHKHHSSNNNNATTTIVLPKEAAELKQKLQNDVPPTVFHFSFSRMKKVVVPPVTIPEQLAHKRALTSVVAGKRIPMTKAMWENERHRFIEKRLPDRIDEQLKMY